MADWRALIARTLAQEPAGRFPEVLPVSTRQNLPAEDGGTLGFQAVQRFCRFCRFSAVLAKARVLTLPTYL